MIHCKIDVKKIDKSALFVGEKGTYADLTLIDNANGTDQYGQDGFIVQELSRERRDAGEKNPIIGNFKRREQKQQAPARQEASTQHAPSNQSDDDDDIPF